MNVIATLRVPAADCVVGRALSLRAGMTARFVPIEGGGRQYLWIRGDTGREDLLERLRSHEAVGTAEVLDVRDDGTLYAIDWNATDGPLLSLVDGSETHLVRGEGTRTFWDLDVRFGDHDVLEGFVESARDRHVSVTVRHLYNPTKPEAGPGYGLTDRQRDALERAVTGGYYDIPRQVTTVDLANDLEISDQAVTERLRRGIRTLVGNTLLVSP